MKKIIFFISVILFILFFISPWLWIDNGEDVIEYFCHRYNCDWDDNFFDIKKDKNGKRLCDCDGSCVRVEWVPFGVKMENCSYDYYYVSPLKTYHRIKN